MKLTEKSKRIMTNIFTFICVIMFISIALSMEANAKAFYLTEKEKAPFSGILLDEYSYKQATQESKELVEYKKLNLIDTELIETLKKQQKDNDTIKMLYFIGGIVVGGLVTNGK